MENLQLVPQKAVRDSALIPKKTKSYIPVPNGTFIDAILEEADKRNFTLRSEEWKLAMNGGVMHGFLTFHGDSPDMGMQAGILNSYNKEKPATIAIGSTVFICTNGVISADYSLKRRHTMNVWQDLTTLISTAMARLDEEYHGIVQIKNTLSGIALSKREQAELLGQMYVGTDILNPSMLSVVREEILQSTFEPFREDTAWAFYNHITYALRKAHILQTDKKHIEFHKMMKNLFVN